MRQDKYPTGSVTRLLQTDLVTPPTRQALTPRLTQDKKAQSTFFDAASFETLRAVCARLFAPLSLEHSPDLAANLDERLASGKGDGWRYSALPPDEQTHRQGLQGLDQSANLLFGINFAGLSESQQNELLRRVQQGNAPGPVWQSLAAPRYFEELLAELCEFYYSDPQVQEEIGYVGMADGRGWRALGLNQLEDWEPRVLPEKPIQAQGVPASIAVGKMIQPAAKPAAIGPKAKPGAGAALAHSQEAGRAIPPMRHYALDEEVDVVVIGTGAGGAPVMARLAAAGLKVVALEAGKFWRPALDFATDERAQSKLFWNDERLSAGKDPIAFGKNNSGIGVGGSTLHFTAYVPRAQPDDFKLYREFGVGQDWPLDYADLEPYYDELERFLGVSGPSLYPWGPARQQPYPLAPLPLNGAAQLMQRGCAQLGLRSSPAANAALSAPYFQPGVGWRAVCTNRGFCQAGCNVGAKASTDVTFVPVALQAGAELRPESFVTRFETEVGSGRLTGVIYSQAGQEYRQRCRAVFLSAGAIETPRLLLLNNLANASGQVGRNFMAHVGVQVWGQFEEEVRPYKGIPGGLISEDTHRPAGADFAGGYLLQSIGVMPVTYVSQLARGQGLWGEELHAHMSHYNHTAGINILGECLPSPHNYLELSAELDGRGWPKPRIYFNQGENEQRLAAHAEGLMRQIWQEAGAQEMWSFPRFAHTLGTARMGTKADTAVVDRDGRSFAVPNLYIVDNSVFPSALSVNPALTLMAFSLRAADRFLARANRREI